jgi:lipopolysaccharide export LptBFGC system permease protein LptF
MNQYHQPPPPDKDPQLWYIAQRRASFKYHLATYIIVNIFFWVLWYFSGSYSPEGWPWPVWPMLGWGIGLFFHYLGAYVFPKENSVEREYEKLKKQKEQ